jgi:hypothetical protein
VDGRSAARRKLDWGTKRLHELSREALAFEHSDAYVPRIEVDVRSPQEIHYCVFAAEQEAPSVDWSLMAGEVIQAFRSALDYLIYALSKRGKRQFPIFTDRCEFQVIGAEWIKRVPAPVRALIEKAQPYEHTPEWPKVDPLAELHKLSNIDKHRTLTTIACSVDFTSIGVATDYSLEWINAFAAGPLGHEDTEVASFIIRSKSEIDQVKVKPEFSYEVRIEGRPLVTSLVDYGKRVFEIITECESGKPMPLWAEYPIQQPLPGRHLDGSAIRRRRHHQSD